MFAVPLTSRGYLGVLHPMPTDCVKFVESPVPPEVMTCAPFTKMLQEQTMFAATVTVLVTRVVPMTSRLYRGKLLLTPTLFVVLFTKSVLLMEVIYLSRGILF